MATVVRDTGIQTGAGVATDSASFGVLPAIGNHVMVASGIWAGSTPGMALVNDNQSHTYQEDGDTNNATFQAGASLWTTKVATSSGTFTVTIDGDNASIFVAWVAFEVSGLNGKVHLDRTGTGSSATGSANATASAQNTTNKGMSVLVAAVTNTADTDINIDDTPPSGYTNLAFYNDGSSIQGFSCVYKTYSALETSSGTFTHDAVGAGWCSSLATYKDAPRIAYVNDFTNTYASSSTCAVTVSGYAVGDVVFVCIGKSTTDNRTISSVVDNAGTPNTYTKRATINEGAALRTSVIFGTVVTDATATTVTVTWSGNCDGRVSVIVARPTEGSAVFDNSGTASTLTDGTSHPSSAGINVAADSFAVAVGQLSANGGTITPPDGWTRFHNDGAGQITVFFYREVMQGLSSETATWTSSTARHYANSMASYTLASVGRRFVLVRP